MKTDAHVVYGGRRVALSGRFDAHETGAFRDVVDATVTVGPATLWLDLIDVAFVDSTALAEMLRARKLLQAEGGDLVLSGVSDPVRVILELTTLDAIFTREQAPLHEPA